MYESISKDKRLDLGPLYQRSSDYFKQLKELRRHSQQVNVSIPKMVPIRVLNNVKVVSPKSIFKKQKRSLDAVTYGSLRLKAQSLQKPKNISQRFV